VAQLRYFGAAQVVWTDIPAHHAGRVQKISKDNLGKRFEWLNQELAGKQYLMGNQFTIAGAYLFTVLRWVPRIELDLAKWPTLQAYVDRIAARPKVQEAMKTEGLLH
jgi:glutathione S-transferase